MNFVSTLKLAGALGLGLGLAACSSGNPVFNPGKPAMAVGAQPTGKFVQIELLSRPAVKELFESFNNHKVTNSVEPYNDPTLNASILSFASAFRSTTTATTIQSVLYPNEYAVNLASTATKAAYLGVETAGFTGSTFGGRAISDDVIGTSLAVVFGNVLSAPAPGGLALIADDGKENNCLSAQNIALRQSQTPGTTFPYFAQAH